jgi:hypothetical protein
VAGSIVVMFLEDLDGRAFSTLVVFNTSSKTGVSGIARRIQYARCGGKK